MMKSDEQIMEELRQAAGGLMMMSESDYPFEVVNWEQSAEVTPDFLRGLTGQPQAIVSVESVEDFFRAALKEHEGQAERERQAVEQYRRLLLVLAANLADVRVYKVGEINIAAFVVGKAPSGRWLGLSTRVVET